MKRGCVVRETVMYMTAHRCFPFFLLEPTESRTKKLVDSSLFSASQLQQLVGLVYHYEGWDRSHTHTLMTPYAVACMFAYNTSLCAYDPGYYFTRDGTSAATAPRVVPRCRAAGGEADRWPPLLSSAPCSSPMHCL
jgi:hypothetical protein